MNIELKKATRLLTKDKVCREDIDIIPVLQAKTVTENGIVTPDAGYVGLSRVTVETPETYGTVLGNSKNPLQPKLGRLKYYKEMRTAIRYKDVYMCNDSAAGTNYDSYTLHGLDPYNTYNSIYNSFSLLPETTPEAVFADGVMYHGYKSTHVFAQWLNVNIGAAILDDMYLPACVCKVVSYDPATNKIKETEYPLNGRVFEALSVSGTMEQCAAVNNISVGVNFDGGQVIAVEFVYPKADVTFSAKSTGWKYSAKYAQPMELTSISDNLVLSGVEDIYVYNGTGEMKTITPGAGEQRTLFSGQGEWVPVSADGKETWVLS